MEPEFIDVEQSDEPGMFEQLLELVERYLDAGITSLPEVIGTLELVKATLVADAIAPSEDPDPEAGMVFPDASTN